MNDSGKAAEQLAAQFLQRQGLVLLEANYRCRFGEIDLVMRDGKEIVFVEVRLRSNASFGDAAASITHSKQKKLVHAAEHYLTEHGSAACRFDAVLLDGPAPQRVEWIRNAFEACA
ncbi:MAG: YraN family protein [Nitrosomonadales bacterium]|nr:MAG: YraN family protein [Nitrosomonadales bacterium]